MSDDIRRKKKKQPRKNKAEETEARPGSEGQARVAKGPPPKGDVGDEKEKVTQVKTIKTTEQTEKSNTDTCTKIVFFLSILGNITNNLSTYLIISLNAFKDRILLHLLCLQR